MEHSLAITMKLVERVNDFLTRRNNPVIDRIFEIIEKYGGSKKINETAAVSGRLENLMDRLEKKSRPRADQVLWLMEQKLSLIHI